MFGAVLAELVQGHVRWYMHVFWAERGAVSPRVRDPFILSPDKDDDDDDCFPFLLIEDTN